MQSYPKDRLMDWRKVTQQMSLQEATKCKVMVPTVQIAPRDIAGPFSGMFLSSLDVL